MCFFPKQKGFVLTSKVSFKGKTKIKFQIMRKGGRVKKIKHKFYVSSLGISHHQKIHERKPAKQQRDHVVNQTPKMRLNLLGGPPPHTKKTGSGPVVPPRRPARADQVDQLFTVCPEKSSREG